MTFAQVTMFLSDMGSKQELDSYSEAYKRHEVIASVQLVTYMYCIQISMFKHPVSCLHVIGLLWPAVCKHANLLLTLVSTKIFSHKVANKKMFTPVVQFHH